MTPPPLWEAFLSSFWKRPEPNSTLKSWNSLSLKDDSLAILLFESSLCWKFLPIKVVPCQLFLYGPKFDDVTIIVHATILYACLSPKLICHPPTKKQEIKTTYSNAPINVNPVGGGGGVRARGGDLTNFKNFWSNSPGWETKGQSKVSKKPPPQGKNLKQQYYNTI